jgi:hypothetical protein
MFVVFACILLDLMSDSKHSPWSKVGSGQEKQQASSRSGECDEVASFCKG